MILTFCIDGGQVLRVSVDLRFFFLWRLNGLILLHNLGGHVLSDAILTAADETRGLLRDLFWDIHFAMFLVCLLVKDLLEI